MDLLRLAFAVFLVGCLPGWFWSKVLYPGGGSMVLRLVYSGALSAALVPAVTLAAVRATGSGVTTAVVVFAGSTVFLSGLAAFWRFGTVKGSGDLPALSEPPALEPDAGVLVALAFSSVSMLAAVLGLFPISWSLSLVAGALAYAVVRLYKGCGKPHAGSEGHYPGRPLAEDLGETEVKRANDRGALGPTAHRRVLGLVLVLVLFRGYAGPVIHDWPFIRGVDQYNHAVMANEMLSDGRIFPYLIYPPGFHTMTANVSLLSGLEPLEIFPLLAPSILLLPVLSLYVLARRLWGPDYGLAAAAFAGLVLNGPYQYFSDAMYPNMFTSQFLLILSIAGLLELYARPSLRTGLLFVLLGSSVVLYHQVASLYLVLSLISIGAYSLYRLHKADYRRNAILLASLVAMAALSALYAWDTYLTPKPALGIASGSEEAATGNAVSMAVNTQMPFSPVDLVGTILTQPVAWLGALGTFLLLRVKPSGDGGPTHRFARFVVLTWVAVFAIGSVNPLTGFPQRFARDLGMPLALLAALISVSLLGALVSSWRSGPRASRLLLVLGASSMFAAVGTQAAINLKDATGTRTPLTFTNGLTVTPKIAAAGEWLQENNTTDGNIMVSPQGNQVPSRMMLAMGRYSAMQSYPEDSILWNRDLPPAGADTMWDVLHVMEYPAGERTRSLLRNYDVRYVALFKDMPDRDIVPYWRDFTNHADLYRIVFENEDVLIVEPRRIADRP